jgi:hypothetical protein
MQHGMRLELPFRRATPDDAHALAELIDFAGEGMPSYLWARMAEPGEGIWDVGRRRAKREEGGFSYRNAVVLEEGGRVAACLIGYPGRAPAGGVGVPVLSSGPSSLGLPRRAAEGG